ncbi:pyridoxal-phosphate dependent enzyme [Salinirussus salinus]|uniref:pyridoxal-phosphate dependent enzyme n=1 Tax=Salinirussus salinus TaxID=1198300 RepID=UPI00135A1F27|nr:pyridoxal-phosphate dependent enzyme [Salinirussus salinus]
MYECRDCGREYPLTADAPWRCDCGHALDFGDLPRPADGGPPATSALDRDRGLWAFADFLPVGERVTLGEGWTPLVDAPAWNAEFKLDYLFPTGSFKDRGAAVTLSLADALGVERVVEDSSGNAGHAIATYAARAGLAAEIFVPADAKPAKREAIERTGATAVGVEGSRQDVTDACIERVETGKGWYASHAWQPAFFAGTATCALELAAQRGWSVPDVVVTPLGHGTLFLGAYRGFRALAAAGWTDDVPRLVGAQAAGAAPIVEGVHGPDAAAGDNDAADGIQIREPARRDQILAAIEETGGEAIAVDAETTLGALDRLRERGFDTEPTCAVAPAALERLRATGAIGESEDVCVVLTGSGLKA